MYPFYISAPPAVRQDENEMIPVSHDDDHPLEEEQTRVAAHVTNIVVDTLENNDFRRVLYMAEYTQSSPLILYTLYSPP